MADVEVVGKNGTVITTGLSVGGRIMETFRAWPTGNTVAIHRANTEVAIKCLEEETRQKEGILELISKLADVDQLSDNKFNVLMVAYNNNTRI